MLNDIQLPSEFTLESVNKTLAMIIASIWKTQVCIGEVEKGLEAKPNLPDVISAFVRNVPNPDNGMLYLDIYSVHGILKSISEGVNVKLNTLADNFKQQECMYEKLIIKLGQTTRLLQQKNEKIEKKLGNYLNYTQGHFAQELANGKTKRVFENWKKQSEKNKRIRGLLTKTLKKINRFAVAKSFSQWKSKVTPI